MCFFNQIQLQSLSFHIDVGVSPKIVINTGFTRTLTYESFIQVTEDLLTVWKAYAEICSLPQLERTEMDALWMHYRKESKEGVSLLVSPGWRWSKHFWKLIGGSGPKRLQFYFQMMGVLSLVTVIVSLLICHKTSVKSETLQVELELPLSGQIQLFSTSSLMGRDLGWETEYYNLQLTHSFLQSPIST